jgi:chaperonin GroES
LGILLVYKQCTEELRMIRPFGDRIVTKRIGSETVGKNGVIKPSGKKEKPLLVEIVCSGVTGVEEGKRFYISRYSGVEIELDGEDLLVITPEDILFEYEEEK